MRREATVTTIYYDDNCQFCTAIVETIEHSSQGSVLLLSPISANLPVGVSMKEARRNIHVVDELGTVLKGADAVLFIISQYPRWRWLATVGKLPGITYLVRLGYRIIADNRYLLFGKVKSIKK